MNCCKVKTISVETFLFFQYLEQMRRFRYRTTATYTDGEVARINNHQEVLQALNANTRNLQEELMRLSDIEATMNRWRDQLPTFLPQPHQRISAGTSWSRRRGAATSEFRRDIYRRNLYVDPESISDITGRYRECSPAWYRTNPAQTHRLVPWLNRELNALLEGSEHQSVYVTQKILQLVERFEIRSPEFHEKLLPYLGNRTDHFQHELYHFARSVYDMIGYDRSATHIENTAQMTAEVISSDNDDDDDVVVVDEIRRSDELVRIPEMPSASIIMGPSTSSGASSSVPFHRLVIPSSDSSDNDENATNNARNADDVDSKKDVVIKTDDVEVVGYVKPRRERTPVIIDLSSEDEKLVVVENAKKKESIIEIEISSGSDSDSPKPMARPFERSIFVDDSSSDEDADDKQRLDAEASAHAEFGRVLEAERRREAKQKVMSYFLSRLKDKTLTPLTSDDEDEPRRPFVPTSSSLSATYSDEQQSNSRLDKQLPKYKGKGKGKGKSSNTTLKLDNEKKRKRKRKMKSRSPSPKSSSTISSSSTMSSSDDDDNIDVVKEISQKKSNRNKKAKKSKRKHSSEATKPPKGKKRRKSSSTSKKLDAVIEDDDDRPLSSWKVSTKVIDSRSDSRTSGAEASNNQPPQSMASSSSSKQPEDLRLYLSRKRPKKDIKVWSTTSSSDVESVVVRGSEQPRKTTVRSIVFKVDSTQKDA